MSPSPTGRCILTRYMTLSPLQIIKDLPSAVKQNRRFMDLGIEFLAVRCKPVRQCHLGLPVGLPVGVCCASTFGSGVGTGSSPAPTTSGRVSSCVIGPYRSCEGSCLSSSSATSGLVNPVGSDRARDPRCGCEAVVDVLSSP